jgi:outer membrane receptor protein involved in Fe transport
VTGVQTCALPISNCKGNNPNCGQYNIAWGVPLWADGFGQVDGSVSYRVNDQLQVSLEAKNLNDGAYKQLMQQQPGMMGRYWYVTGQVYTLRASYNF